MKQRFKINSVVYLVLFRESNEKKEVLLQKRQNTGYMDGKYDFGASGHLECDESLADAVIRESFEELGIEIKKEDLILKTVCHKYAENYVNFAFATDKYDGVPKIIENAKCSDLSWFPINDLPNDIIPITKTILDNISNEIPYQEIK